MTDLQPALKRQLGKGRTASWNWPLDKRLAMSVSLKDKIRVDVLDLGSIPCYFKLRKIPLAVGCKLVDC